MKTTTAAPKKTRQRSKVWVILAFWALPNKELRQVPAGTMKHASRLQADEIEPLARNAWREFASEGQTGLLIISWEKDRRRSFPPDIASSVFHALQRSLRRVIRGEKEQDKFVVTHDIHGRCEFWVSFSALPETLTKAGTISDDEGVPSPTPDNTTPSLSECNLPAPPKAEKRSRGRPANPRPMRLEEVEHEASKLRAKLAPHEKAMIGELQIWLNGIRQKGACPEYRDNKRVSDLVNKMTCGFTLLCRDERRNQRTGKRIGDGELHPVWLECGEDSKSGKFKARISDKKGTPIYSRAYFPQLYAVSAAGMASDPALPEGDAR
jgi:hypothetical protein